MRARWIGALAGLLALTACSQRPVDKLNDELADRESRVPSCEQSDCAAEVAQLVAALRELPGVVSVGDARYRPKQITDGASVTGTIVVEPGVECDSLEVRAAEIGWTSSVSPLSSVDFSCGTRGTDPAAETAGFLYTSVRPTSAAQLKAWGDRGTLPAG